MYLQELVGLSFMKDTETPYNPKKKFFTKDQVKSGIRIIVAHFYIKIAITKTIIYGVFWDLQIFFHTLIKPKFC